MRYSLKCFWVIYLILGLHTAAYATKTSLAWGTAGKPGEGVSTKNDGAFQRNTWAFNFSTDDGIVHDEMDTSRRVSITKIRLMQRQTKASKPTSATLTQGGNSMAATSVISHDEETGMTLYDYNGNAVRTWSYHELIFPGNVDFDPTQDITLSFNGNVGCWVTQPANSVMAHQSWSPVIEITAFYAVDYMATLNGDVAFSKITSWQPARPAAFSEEDGLGITNSVDAVLTLDEPVAVRAFTFTNEGGKLTLRYVDASTLPAARYWDFSAATGKVAIDCSALKAAATLITGSIRGVANIDVAGSSLPAGGKLLVTDTSVRLQMIDKATWTGGAGDYDATKPGNWTCTDFDGNTIAGVIPDEETTIIVNETLTADADWTVLGPVAFSADTVINLGGHNFAIAGFRSKDGVAAGAQINNDKTTGDFIVNVPEGTTTENATVSIKGTTRLVKEGAGTFVGKVQNQSYTGGTLVRAGTIQSSGSESKLFYGARVSTMTVDPDGTLDVNGQYDWNNHDIVLNGGTLANNGAHQTTYGNGGLGNMTLTADSKMELKYHILFNRSAGATLDLGGCMLSVTRVNSSENILFTLESKHGVTNGTLVCGNNIRFFTRGSGVNLTDTKLDLNYSWRKNYAIVAYDLTCNLVTSEDDKQITVTGRFATNGNYDNVKLTDGAVLDLSGNTGALSTMSGISSRKLTFAEEAAIAVDLADRTDLKQDMQVVSWTDAMTPAESVTFTPKGAFYNLVRKADGLYLDRGVMTIFR